MQAIILAGGLGTRLRAVLSNVPKPMAPIHGKPFLAYLLAYLKEQGFNQVVLSIGYRGDQIRNYFKTKYAGLTITYAAEQEPLGTGGAIVNALQHINSDEPCFVLNGDTFINLDYQLMLTHRQDGAKMHIALCHIANCYRYGEVRMNEDSTIIAFNQQGSSLAGLINTGVYLFEKSLFKEINVPEKFSFEKDFLTQHLSVIKPKGFVANNYFIDIGIPDDYARARREFQKLEPHHEF